MPNQRPVITINPANGEEREWGTMVQCAQEIRCNLSTLSIALKRSDGKETIIKGWKVREKFPRVGGPPRNRPRKPVVEAAPKPVVGVAIPEEVKPFAGGAGDIKSPNEAKQYLRAKLLELSATIDLATSGAIELPRGMDPRKILDVYKAIADSWSIDWKHLGDTRSDAEKTKDAVDKLIASPAEAFALLDDEIAALEDAMATAERHAKNFVDHFVRTVKGEPEPPEAALGKARAEALACWLKRIRRVKELRRLARETAADPAGNKNQWLAREATRVLRYQAYVGRSDMVCRPGISGPGSTVFVFGKLHAKIAVDLYIAEHRIGITPRGVLRPGDKYRAGGKKNTLATYPGVKYTGALLMYPPRHGKTVILRHWAAQRIAENPRVQGAYAHALEAQATAFLRNVSSLFSAENASGRRNLSLYPGLRFAAYDNTSSKLRLHTDEPPRSPNLYAAGVWSAVLGMNLDFLIGDDLVPRDDRDQPTERERRKQQFSGTWVTRIQGNGFVVLSGYPWHFDDLMWVAKTEAQRAVDTGGAEGLMLKLSHWAVGGPTTEPKWKAIFPELYPPQKLRSIYRAINDPEIWAANYMLQPITDELRIVRAVELFDERPESDPYEHARFMDHAEVHLSLDPAFAGKEHSDKAGIVLVAIGNLEINSAPNRTAIRTVIRVIHAEEVRATQPELAAIVGDIARKRRVDRVHVELTSGSYVMRPFLESFEGITSVIEHPVRNRNKEQRLRLVAPMLEASSPEIRPVVQLPGVRNENGRVVLNRRFQRIHDYVVNFRATTGHHSLDALTQVLNYLAPRCGIGEGEVSKESRSFRGGSWQRQAKQAILAECRAPRPPEPWKTDRRIMEFVSGGAA